MVKLRNKKDNANEQIKMAKRGSTKQCKIKRMKDKNFNYMSTKYDTEN